MENIFPSKIPLLRMHNSAVDTGSRDIFPSTNRVFYIPSAREVTTGKSRALITDTTENPVPGNFLHSRMPEKLRPENPGQ
jgi:hypothetical protein